MFIAEGAKDSVAMTATFDADSSVITSAPYMDPSAPAGSPQMMFRAVARLTGENTMAGMTALMLASKPDSVIARSRWTATRQGRQQSLGVGPRLAPEYFVVQSSWEQTLTHR